MGFGINVLFLVLVPVLDWKNADGQPTNIAVNVPPPQLRTTGGVAVAFDCTRTPITGPRQPAYGFDRRLILW